MPTLPMSCNGMERQIELMNSRPITSRYLLVSEDFSMKRVTVWAIVFAEAFFVGALIGRALSMLKM